MTIAIFEGCDGVGKTHLARWVAQRVSRPLVLHRGVPRAHPLVEYELALEVLYDAEPSRVVICDRWHWGELIYGEMMRGRSLLGTAGRLHVDMWLAARGGVVFHVEANERVVRERLITKDERYLPLEYVPHVLQAYRQVAREVSPLQHLTVHSDDIDRVMNALTLPVVNGVHPSYVGPPRPRALLAGDRRHKLAESTHMAAFVPYKGTSGDFLLTHLPVDMRSTTGLINTDTCEVEDVAAEWERLGEPRVIALGVNAARALERADVPHGVVPHPQYVRRFHHARGTEYGGLIAKVVHTQEDASSWN